MYLRHCFVMCGFILKSYTFLLILQVGDALFVEIPKGHLGALEAYGGKLNIPGQRPERIFRGNCCVMSGFISQHENFCLFVCLFVCLSDSPGWKCSFCGICGKTVWSPLIPVVKSRLAPRYKPWRNDLWNCFACLHSSHRVLSIHVLETGFSWNLPRHIGEPMEAYVEKSKIPAGRGGSSL